MAHTRTPNAALDTNELMHLALRANEQGDTDKTIAYLKRILDAEPENGMALYLLAAQHAQLNMTARAIEEMARAIELEPNIPVTAHFQLGLLCLMAGAIPEAVEAWIPLDQLDDDNPLSLFRRGLEHLIKDELPECIDNLERGIAANDVYPDLNRDMQGFADTARSVMLRQHRNPPPESRALPKDSETNQSADLSAYRSDTTD